MKARLDAILQREQAEYLDNLLPSSTGLLAEIEDYAAKHRVPIADREVALFLEITARAVKARRVLEIGMAIGYSAIHFARALTAGGIVVTIEPDEEMIRLAEDFLTRSHLRDRVRIERGRALEVMPRLNDEPFDIVFIDALKEEYSDYLELAVPMLRSGGIIIADNLLWGGEVADETRHPQRTASTEALRQFNQTFVQHPQLQAEVLPVGDGLGYGVKL